MRSDMVGAGFPASRRSAAHLNARGLQKDFGEGAVLDGVSFIVSAGQCLGVIGDNGSGKSTLLRVLAGRLDLEGGEVICTTETRSLVEQELDASAGATVATLHSEALRAPREALARLEDAAAALAAGEDHAGGRYAAALARAEDLEAWDAERRLTDALTAFDAGFTPDRRLAHLSVGQRYRLRLACALADLSGTVLLDEPSNHLDLASLDRLVRWLRGFPGIAVLVTHDRWLLDAVATAIFDLDPARNPGGTLFGGGFAAYRDERAHAMRDWRRRYAESLDGEQRLAAQLTRARAATPGHWLPGKGAAKHGRESRAASSVRMLQRRLDRLRRTRGPAPPEPLVFTPPDTTATADSVLLDAAGITVNGRLAQPADSLIRLQPGSRLLVAGANGAGKSTLLQVLAGRLTPDTGRLVVAPGTRVELLGQEDDWNLRQTAAATLGDWDLDQVRATGLLRDADLGRRLGRLSVGQRRRVALARVLLRRPAVLLLDEPTNHLSVMLIDELSDALLQTPAAVVIVTHDRTLRHTIRDWPTLTLMSAESPAP